MVNRYADDGDHSLNGFSHWKPWWKHEQTDQMKWKQNAKISSANVTDPSIENDLFVLLLVHLFASYSVMMIMVYDFAYSSFQLWNKNSRHSIVRAKMIQIRYVDSENVSFSQMYTLFSFGNANETPECFNPIEIMSRSFSWIQSQNFVNHFHFNRRHLNVYSVSVPLIILDQKEQQCWTFGLKIAHQP